MKKKKIYISLPITGRKIEDYTQQCRDAQEYIESLGFEAVSFLDTGLPTEAPVSEHMRADYKLLLDCDAILMCEGWEYSHGCMNELQVAADCRMPVLKSRIEVVEYKVDTSGIVINEQK